MTTSPNGGDAVIAEAQAFVAAAKARQDYIKTFAKTSSLLQTLRILQDHDAPALATILGKDSRREWECVCMCLLKGRRLEWPVGCVGIGQGGC